MKKIFVFSGLGADERVFYKLNFGEYKPVFIKWLDPHKNETIEDYALRLTEQITVPKPILLGLSFGGMIAIEVAKHIDTEKIVLLSSAKCRKEVPAYYKLAGFLHLSKLIPATFYIKANMFTNWFFSSRTREDKQMLSAVLHDTDPVFLKWAINCIVSWKNNSSFSNLYHIHGTADHILPFKNIVGAISIPNGTHLMLVNKPLEISNMLQKLLA